MRRAHAVWLAGLAACGRFHFAEQGNGDGNGNGDDGDPGGLGDADISIADGLSMRTNNIAFVSSAGHDGALGGAGGADAFCQGLATTAGFVGTFVAFNRLNPDAQLAGSSGWIDVSGAPVADQPGDWMQGGMISPLRRDEHGLAHDAQTLWINDGCASWTTNASIQSWFTAITSEQFYTETRMTNCATAARVICAETGHSAPLAITPAEPRRRAFVTATDWVPSGGITAADAACDADKVAAGLNGTFHALLATSTASAFSRFSLTGPPWTRIDGVPLAPTAAEFASGSPAYLDAFITQADGGPVQLLAVIDHYIGTTSLNCTDWTTNTPSRSADVGYTNTVDHAVFLDSGTTISCNAGARLLCLEL